MQGINESTAVPQQNPQIVSKAMPRAPLGKSTCALRKLIGVFVVVAAILLAYWALTALAIRWCARDLTRGGERDDISFISSSDETRFLVFMGRRSIGPLVNQIERANVDPKKKVHLAWILSSIGDHSHFDIFVQALNSDKSATRFIAVARMRDFPDECLQHLPGILKAAVNDRELRLEPMIESLVDHMALPAETKRDLKAAVGETLLSNPLPTSQAIDKLLFRFGEATSNHSANE
jgi:hypothetical protein